MHIPTRPMNSDPLDLLFFLSILAWLLGDRDPSLTKQIQSLRECIDVLFMFQRKPAKDDVFVRDTRSWLTRWVS